MTAAGRDEQLEGNPDLRGTGERIEALLDSAAAGGAAARERAEELVRLVSDLYGAGLERILDLLHDAGRLDEEMLERIADDDLLAGLLIVHGLHPYDVQTRVERALESVRPYLGSHGGDVELLGVSESGVVALRLLGSCDGCPSSSVTLRLAVQDAIESAAPEVESIEVEERADDGGRPLIPVDSLRSRIGAGQSAPAGGSWHQVPVEVGRGETTVLDLAGVRVLLCRVGEDLFAFRDACARCDHSLAGVAPERRMGGAVGDALLRCPGCGARYDVRRAGACADDDALHLDPLPLLVADPGVVSVALPTEVPA